MNWNSEPIEVVFCCASQGKRSILFNDNPNNNMYRRDSHLTFFPVPKEIGERDWEKGELGAYLRKYAFHTPQKPE
jgi:hypothetical protein